MTTPSPASPDRPVTEEQRPRSLAPAGIVLGVGFGGFVDGIVLHQLLQWHHMLTSTDSDNVGIPYYPRDTVHGLEINTVWDGVFHVFTWLMVLTGMSMLFSRVQQGRGQVWKRRALWSWVLVGWGLFNLVEGLVDHQILGIHHVRSGAHQLAWDMGFLALGAVLVVGGWLLSRSVPRPADDR
jgi:uncharacterized membrane protein